MFGEQPEIPECLSFSTAPLSKIFENRCNSYKYFWFLALLYYVAENKTSISFHDMAKRMVAIAWYPSAYCCQKAFKNSTDKALDVSTGGI